MVSVFLPSDALLQHLPSYLGSSYLGRGVSLHGWSSKAQPLLLMLDEGYLLTTALPDLQRGMAPLVPPAPVQAPLLGHGVAPPGRHPWPRMWDNFSQPFLRPRKLALSATAPDLRRGVTPLGHRPSGIWSSWPSAPDLGHAVAPLSHALCTVTAACEVTLLPHR